MKKMVIFVLSMLFLLAGCIQKIEPTPETYGYTIIQTDWIRYQTVEEAVDESENVFYGKVTDISFAVIDMLKDEVVTASSQDIDETFCVLHTILTVSVTENIKGDAPSEVKIAALGGVKGFKEKEQYELLSALGFMGEGKRVTITEYWEKNMLEIDTSYLFSVCYYGTTFYHIINPWQYAYPAGSDEAKAVEQVCTNAVS